VRSFHSSLRAGESASTLMYNRKGEQPAFAPTAIRSVFKASNGINVACHDDLGPVSTLAFIINAGSRHENPTAPGVAHMLKNSLFRTVKGDSIVRTVRETELRGNTLYTAHTRESIVVATEFLRDDLVDAVPLLVNNLFNNSFQPYEFLDARTLVYQETTASLADPLVKVVDTLHNVAFRTGLGNSLFANEVTANGLKRKDVHEFIAKYFTADRIALVGSGVNQTDLKELLEPALQAFSLPPTFTGSVAPTKYFGGEVRFNSGLGSESLFALAFPSASSKSVQGYATALVLRALLDGTKRLSWGSPSGSSSLLACCATPKTSVSAFSTSYTDAGLLGFYIQGDAADVKQVAQRSIDALKSVAAEDGFTDVSVNRAKKAAIVESESSAECSRQNILRKVGMQVLSSGSFFTSSELAEAIGKVSKTELVKLASTALSAPASAVCHGNTLLLPYLDQLKF